MSYDATSRVQRFIQSRSPLLFVGLVAVSLAVFYVANEIGWQIQAASNGEIPGAFLLTVPAIVFMLIAIGLAALSIRATIEGTE